MAVGRGAVIEARRFSTGSAACVPRAASEPDRDEDLEDVGVQLVERLVARTVFGGEQRVAEVLVVDEQVIEAHVGRALADPRCTRYVELVRRARTDRPVGEGRELAV